MLSKGIGKVIQIMEMHEKTVDKNSKQSKPASGSTTWDLEHAWLPFVSGVVWLSYSFTQSGSLNSTHLVTVRQVSIILVIILVSQTVWPCHTMNKVNNRLSKRCSPSTLKTAAHSTPLCGERAVTGALQYGIMSAKRNGKGHERIGFIIRK